MGNSRKILFLILGITMISVSGCATTTAPRGYLPTPLEAQSQAYGAWTTVRYSDKSKKLKGHGELIAVDGDSVYLLTETGLLEIPIADISRAKLTTYNPGTGSLAGWTFLGTLSTVSHGWFLGLTAPLWIISGTSITSNESFTAQVNSPPTPWEEVRKFARFPQGLPEGFKDE